MPRGNQEGALKGYDPENKGRKSYHPLFRFEYYGGQSMFGTLRKGDARTSAGSKDLLKEDYYLADIPTEYFKANEFYLEILLFSYDLIKRFQRLCLPLDWRSKTLQTLRNEILPMPGSFVKHGNKHILRFPKNSPQQKVFLEAKRKAEKLNNLNEEFKRTKLF